MSEKSSPLTYGNYVQIAFNAKQVDQKAWNSLPYLVQITSVFVRDCSKFSKDNYTLDSAKLVVIAHRWYLLNGHHISPAFAKFAHLSAGLSVVASFTAVVWKFGPLITFEAETSTTTPDKSVLKSWPHKLVELCDFTSSAAAVGENLVNFTVLPINLRGVFQTINAPTSACSNAHSAYNTYLDTEQNATNFPTYYWMGVAVAVSYIFITFASIGPYVVATTYVTTLVWAKTHTIASLVAVTFSIGRHYYDKISIKPDFLG